MLFKDAFPKIVGNEEKAQPPIIANGFPTKECTLCLVPCRTKSVDEEENLPLLAVHYEKKFQGK